MLLPLVLGLLGFVQPCVVGVNSIFLGYLKGKDRVERTSELVKYVAVKTFSAAILGIAAGLVGGLFLSGASITILRALLVIFGFVYIASRFRPMPVPNLVPRGNFSKGILYGLGVPACAVPLLISLSLISAFSGNARVGLTMLAVFGATISLPLLLIGASGRATDIMKHAARVTGVSPVFAGLALIAAGFNITFA